jgi:hypothetical protein
VRILRNPARPRLRDRHDFRPLLAALRTAHPLPQLGARQQSRKNREGNSAVAQRSMRMIDYAMLGQLVDIIRDNWDLLAHQFVSKSAGSIALAKLNLARSLLAHCCAISDPETERLKPTLRDWFNILKKPAS